MTAFRRLSAPAPTDWALRRVPLALRGIRCVEGPDSAAPAAPAAPVAPAAPSPADVAAFVAARQSAPAAQPPAAAPAAPAAAPVQQVQGFTPEQVQKLMADNAAAVKALEDAKAELSAAATERDAAKAQVAEHARQAAISSAADGKANAALLLDSGKFQTAIKDVDLADAAKLTAAIESFVKDNPAYAVTAAPQLPGASGPAPAGSTTDTPKTLQGAIAARLAG